MAEAAGLLVTVLFLDWMLESQERKRSLPARFQAYLALNRVVGKFLNLWREIVTEAYSADSTVTVDYFSPVTITRVEKLLSLHSMNKNVYPVEPWHRTILRTIHEMQSAVDNCLLRFGPLLDGEIVESLHQFEQLTTIRMWKSACEVAPHHKISNFPVFNDSFGKDLKTLHHVSSVLQEHSSEFKKLQCYLLPAKIEIVS
jgi:hypothetical protein